MSAYGWVTNAVLTIHWFSGASGLKGVYIQKASQSLYKNQFVFLLALGLDIMVGILAPALILCRRAAQYWVMTPHPFAVLKSHIG
jgi:hypothetical protein